MTTREHHGVASRPAIRELLRDWAGGELKGAAFARVAQVAAARGIAVLPVKGVLTSRLLYAQPAERPMVNVNVRVRARNLDALCAAGVADGWKLVERWRAYRCAAFEVQGERVELETTIGPPGYCATTVDAMIARATEHVAPFGVPHLQPEMHDHALLLMVNAFKDKLAQASDGGLNNLSRLASRPGFSFETLAQRLREGRITGLGWLVAEWMVEPRGDVAWRELGRALGGRPPARLYAAAFHALGGGARRGPLGRLASRLLVRAAPDSVTMKARSLLTMLAWSAELAAVSPELARRKAQG